MEPKDFVRQMGSYWQAVEALAEAAAEETNWGPNEPDPPHEARMNGIAEILSDAAQKAKAVETRKDSEPRYRCPKCKGTKFQVVAEVWVELIQHDNGDLETDADSHRLADRSHEWNGDSPAACLDCDFRGKVEDFAV